MSARRPSFAGALVKVVIGVVSFLVVSALFRALVPSPPDFEITQKLAHFEDHAADYDAVVRRGISFANMILLM